MSKAEVTYILMAAAGLILAAGVGYALGLRDGRRVERDAIRKINGLYG